MTHLFSGVLVSAVLVATTGTALAQINCRTDKHPVELIICAHADLVTLDKSMSDIYFGIKKRLEKAGIETRSLLAGQRSWLAKRDACHDDGCVRAAYISRIAGLEAFRDGIMD